MENDRSRDGPSKGGVRSRRKVGGPTVSDVARVANVSQMTVSRVISGAAAVAPQKRSDVLKAIETLGYVPNRAAKNLAGGQSRRIALLYDNPSAAYMSELLLGAIEAASELDAEMVVERFDRGSRASLATRLARHQIDAVLLPPPMCDDDALLDMLYEAGFPVVQLATGCPRRDGMAVMIDDQAAAYAMATRLLDLGHRRIGFIRGNDNQSASALRFAGYERALSQAGLAISPDLVAHGDFSYRSGLDAADRLLSVIDRPTAIFASNDDMGAATIAVACRRGIGVPEQLSVCGFDDTIMATSIWPELTTIRQPVAEMARVAVSMLIQRLRGDNIGLPAGEWYQIDHTLVVRGSDHANARN